MASTTISTSLSATAEIASAAEIRAAFVEHKEELTWLAEFLSDDELTASACVADARDLMENNEEEVCQECLQTWAREATLRSVLGLKQMRIAELSSRYERDDLIAREHAPMPLDTIEFVVRRSDIVRRRLDSLCRFVLVLCGLEHHSVRDAARVLGISKHAVQVAYATVLEFLDVVYCQAVLEACSCATA